MDDLEELVERWVDEIRAQPCSILGRGEPIEFWHNEQILAFARVAVAHGAEEAAKVCDAMDEEGEHCSHEAAARIRKRFKP